MSTDIKHTEIEEDFESVVRHAFNREPLDPEVARRIQERAAEVTERMKRTPRRGRRRDIREPSGR